MINNARRLMRLQSKALSTPTLYMQHSNNIQSIVLPKRSFSINRIHREDALIPTGLDSSQIAHKLEQVQIQSREHVPQKGIFPYRVLGNETTVVEIDLLPGEAIRAETGSLVYMEPSIAIDTSTGGGVGQGLKRLMTGENFFISDFANTGDVKALVCLAAPYPSKIIPLKLEEHGGSLICQKGAFLAGANTTQFEMYSQHSLGAGFFGGEGFILQELVGDGMILLKAGGSLILKELGPGETIRTSSGTLVAFERSVTFGIERLPGVKNMIFGGEGIFLPTLTGPGKVWLQGLPFNRLVDSVAGSIKTGGYGALGGFGAGMGGGSSGSGEGEGGEEGAADENDVEETGEADVDNYGEEEESGGGGGGLFGGFRSWFGSEEDEED
jgi:uncharacterized protein (TIGR00266 family)